MVKWLVLLTLNPAIRVQISVEPRIPFLFLFAKNKSVIIFGFVR